MSDDKEDEGGIVLGGISFGVATPATPPKPVAAGGAPSGASDRGGVASRPAALRDQLGDQLGEHLLPLRCVVVADLIPRDEHNAGPNPPEHATRVEIGYLDALVKRLGPRLAIEVESVLKDGARVRVDFAPSAMKSFRPDSLVRDIPLLRSLLDGKKVLERLRDGTIDVNGAASELARLWEGSSLVARVVGGVEVRRPAATETAAPSLPTEGVSRILDMVDTGPGPMGRPHTPGASDAQVSGGPAVAASLGAGERRGKFDAFIAAVAKSGSDKAGARPDRAIATVEKALSLQLGAIVQHPEFRRLESAWRGLELLASRTPKEGARLEVVSARAPDAPAALERAITAGAGIEPPVSFAVVDVRAEGDAPSFARLRALGEIAERHTVPVITNASAGLVGKTDLHDIDRMDNKLALYDARERAPWRAEATQPGALWIALCVNRVLGRLAYDKRSSRIRDAAVEELPGGDEALVWVEPCWAVASLVLRSFATTGWPCAITGARTGGIVEDLPVHEVATHFEGSDRIAIPTEVFFSTDTQKELARLGILALAAQPNSDAAYLLSATTAYVPPPKQAMDEEGPEARPRFPRAPLGDQLFVARVVQFLRALGSKIGPDENSDDVKKLIEAALWELFRDAAAGTEIHAEVSRGDGGLAATVTLRPRRLHGVTMEEITLGVPLG